MNKTMLLLILILFLPFAAAHPAGPNPPVLLSQQIYWMPFGEALKYARDLNKVVFVYVYTDWCPQCKRMNNLTFNDRTIQDYIYDKFICTKVNAESDIQHECNGQKYTEREIAQMLGVEGYPTMIVLASQGGSLGSFSGYRGPDELKDILIYFGDGHFQEMSFPQWMKGRR